VKDSELPGAGRGLFASNWDYTLRGRTRPGMGSRIIFNRNDKICTYEGEVLNLSQYNARYPRGDSVYVWTPDTEHFIDSRRSTSCFGRFANSPNIIRGDNAEIREESSTEGKVVALKPIHQGEEILINYGGRS